MANIKTHLNNIKGALYGKDVRGSIHDGIDAINKEVENTTGRQVDLENTFDQLVINAGNSNAEIVDARVKNDGTSYSKLGDRLDSIDSQLEQIVSVNIENYKSFVVNNDWSNAFEQAINENKNGEIFVGGNKVYEISSPIRLGKYNSLKVEKGATIKATSLMDCVIEKHNEGTYTFSTYNKITGGGTIECNQKANIGISLAGYRHFELTGLRIQNPLKIGLLTRGIDGAFAVELMCTDVYICNDEFNPTRETVGIRINSTDNHFTNIITVNMDIGIQNEQGGNKFFNCHDWVYDKAKLDEHYCFVDKSDGYWNTCYADTGTVGFDLYGGSLLTNCSVFQSPEFPIEGGSIAIRIPLGSNKLTRIYDCKITGSSNSVVNKAISGEINENVDVRNLVCNNYVLSGIPKNSDYIISKEYNNNDNNIYNFATIKINKKKYGSAMSGKFIVMPNSSNTNNFTSNQFSFTFWIKAFKDINSVYSKDNIEVRVNSNSYYLDDLLKVSKNEDDDNVYINFYFIMSGWQVCHFKPVDLIGGLGMYSVLQKQWVQKLNDNINTILILNEDKEFLSSIEGDELPIIKSQLNIDTLKLGNTSIWSYNDILRVKNGDRTQDNEGQPLIRYTLPPNNYNSVGNIGLMAIDSQYLYVSNGSDSWKRIPFGEW